MELKRTKEALQDLLLISVVGVTPGHAPSLPVAITSRSKGNWEEWGKAAGNIFQIRIHKDGYSTFSGLDLVKFISYGKNN